MRNFTVFTMSVMVLLLCGVSNAAVIDTASGWDGISSVGAFGEPNGATFGQTFVAPSTDSVLDSVTLYLDDFLDPNMGRPDYVKFAFYVMQWDSINSMASGAVLYQSGMYTTTNNGGAGGFEGFTFNTGGLSLSPGSEYVFFLNASDFFDGSWDGALMGITTDEYLGGSFALLNNGSDFDLVTTDAWTIWQDTDLAFTATFSAPSATPIPGAVWLLGTGLLGLVGIRRKSCKN